MNQKIHIELNQQSFYPESNYNFSPSKKYPEYELEELSPNQNYVYEMVRNSFIGLEMDKVNIGQKNWNPFSEFIKIGDNVLIKPNFVRESNHIVENGTDCLITHPSVLRPIIDYTIKALNGTGTIIVADAPVQNCDFNTLIEKNNIVKLINFYKKKNINIELIDLRLSGLQFGEENKYGVSSIDVDLKTDSLFANEKSSKLKKLRITNYPVKEIKKYHSKNHNIYCISNKILNADVIINIPKPKTHKKGGATISLKNMFGGIARKECLPHHTKGGKGPRNCGDEYPKTSLLKLIETNICEKNDIFQSKHGKQSKWLLFCRRVINKLQRIFCKNTIKEGSWYGNDTLWKTIIDINNIVHNCDKNGLMHNIPQRKMFIVADMIVSGENEGPLAPSAKKVGAIIAGSNQIQFDKTISTLMGFDFNKIPSIKFANLKLKELPLLTSSNEVALNNLSDYKFNINWCFIPAKNWMGHIEKSQH